MKRNLVGIAVLFVSLWASLGLAEDTTPQILKAPELPPSQMVRTEVERIYKPSEASGLGGVSVVSPWADANALMTGIRDKMIDMEVKAINTALYLDNIGPGGPYDEVFTAHFWTYCANSSANEKIPGGSCQADSLMQHADINVSSILSGFRYEGDRENAAKMFLNNLIQPFPAPDYLDKDRKLVKEQLSDFEKRKRIAEALSKQAILSVPRSSLAEMIAKRSPISTGKGSVSMMEIMEKEAAQRFLNDAWQGKMLEQRNQALADKKPEQAVLYEIAMIEAYQNWMAYENYRQLERVESLLSALVSLNFKQAEGAAAIGGAAAVAAP